jgi:hypothetical protein
MPEVGGPGGWGPGGNGPGGPRRRRRLPRGPLIPAIATAALIVVVAAIIVATRGGGSNNASDNTTAGSTPAKNPTTSTSASTAARPNVAQRQGATQLAGLLSQNGSDRGNVDNAFYAAAACKTLPNDERVFTKAAAKRDNLVAKIGSLQDVSALNSTMIHDLTDAWQASAQADTDYSKWAGSMEGHCTRGKTGSNPNYQAADGPDSTATADKKAFTKLWNPLAEKYSMAKYNYSQL